VGRQEPGGFPWEILRKITGVIGREIGRGIGGRFRFVLRLGFGIARPRRAASSPPVSLAAPALVQFVARVVAQYANEDANQDVTQVVI